MDSNKNLRELPNNTRPQSSVKGSGVLNGKISRKDKNQRLWKKYLQEIKKSLLTSQSQPETKESVYSLRNLFKAANHAPKIGSNHPIIKLEFNNIPLVSQVDKNAEQMEKAKYSNTNLQLINEAFDQQDINQIISKLNNQPVLKQPLSTSVVERTQDTIKSVNASGPESSSSVVSNHSIKVEIFTLPTAQEAKAEELLKTKSSNSVVMVDFRIINHKEPEIIEISDDEDDENNIQPRNAPIVSQDSIDSTFSKIVFKHLSAASQETSKSFTDLETGQNEPKLLKPSEGVSNHGLRTIIYNLPRTASYLNNNNKLQSKSENHLTFPNNFSKIHEPFYDFNYPSINLKIFNTSSTQVEETENQFNSQTKITSNIRGNVAPKTTPNLDDKTETIVKDNDKRDFTQNISDIAKNMMQSIQGAIFKPCNNTTSTNDLGKIDIKAEEENNKDKQEMHFHIKLKIYNMPLPQQAENQLSNDNNVNVEIEDLKINKEDKLKSLNNNNKMVSSESGILETMPNINEPSRKPAKQNKSHYQYSTYPKNSKRISHMARNNSPILRQCQLKLNNLKIQVEQRRLEILDLKLAREWEGIQKDKILFENYFLPRSLQIKRSEIDDVEI